MKNIRVFLSENFQFLEVKFCIYLNRHVFVMHAQYEMNLCILCMFEGTSSLDAAHVVTSLH